MTSVVAAFTMSRSRGKLPTVASNQISKLKMT
ncbi:hypothetical protein COLO4_11957 [Corchorus olitorius]|uniref:Uncharacterized protein n=1 Tax=Corchorus olitorius TaxID=93759 RepID=A0A1R3K2P5_9ROSI|nr:hypothetical protein COLO4_11957 [Corchorus olitorius]